MPWSNVSRPRRSASDHSYHALHNFHSINRLDNTFHYNHIDHMANLNISIYNHTQTDSLGVVTLPPQPDHHWV